MGLDAAVPELARFFLSSAGFIQADLRTVADELVSWRDQLGAAPKTRPATGDLSTQLRALSPLTTGARPRELLVPINGWVAYFDSFARDTDAASTCPVLSERLAVRSLKIGCAPTGLEFKGMHAGQGVQFHLWGPDGDLPLGYVRTIDAVNDDPWVFEQSGAPLPFEETENYTRRRVRDRFTVDMLERYCQALGIDVFDLNAYGSEGVLVESQVVIPPGGREVWI